MTYNPSEIREEIRAPVVGKLFSWWRWSYDFHKISIDSYMQPMMGLDGMSLGSVTVDQSLRYTLRSVPKAIPYDQDNDEDDLVRTNEDGARPVVVKIVAEGFSSAVVVLRLI